MKKYIYCILLMSLSILFVSCGKGLRAGTYEGVGKGRSGQIRVSVVIDSNGKINRIDVLKNSEHDMIFKNASQKLIKNIVDKNDVNVDVISGATESSKGIKEAVSNALEQAK